MKVQLTSHGLARSEAQGSGDSFVVKTWGETVIAVLADGSGGARAGKEAAERIVKSLATNYEARPNTWSAPKSLAEFTKLINRTLHQESLARYGDPELVSTVAIAVIEGNRLHGLNVGDSRVYLVRHGKLLQLSVDHVLDAALSRHILQRAIGLAEVVEPHSFETDLSDGDLVFLCSDGITNILSDLELATKLRPGVAARAIVQHARERATPETLDDMSAVLIDLAETGKLTAASQRSLPIPETLQKGKTIDGYELVRPFQSSERVWLAKKPNVEKPADESRWTLKFAPKEAIGNDAVLNAFVKESWNATRLDAPFFVPAFIPEDASALYYVMEFVEAPSLKSLIKSRQFAIDETVSLGRFLIEASSYLLRLDLVHGDIKPENILALPEYDRLQFKLVDLGSVAEIFSVTSRAGTASYLAPERFAGVPISERTEIFAIGVTLYEALTRTFPYGEIERFQTPQFGTAKAPTKLNPHVPPWLEAVILRAIATDPTRRYQHFSELAFDLVNPDKVEPFFARNASLLEKHPVGFYKTGFWILLVTTLLLLLRLLTR